MLGELDEAALEALLDEEVVGFEDDFFLFDDPSMFSFDASLGAYGGVGASSDLVSFLGEGLRY